MKEPLTEIDQYLLQAMPEEEKLLFEARMLATPALQEAVKDQAQALQFIRWFGRDLRREKLAAMYNEMDAAFHLTITSIFK